MSISISAKQSVAHYENFPVASWILPKRYRPSVVTLYRFARTADDIADEGDDAPSTRLARLNALLQSFNLHFNCAKEKKHINASPLTDDVWQSVSAPMAELCKQGLPVDYPRALISAFSQDVSVTRYANMADILDYSARSANPVGRTLLYFFDRHNKTNCAMSDAICSALQFINFWQDIAIDWQKKRIYIPAAVLKQHGFLPDGEDSIALFAAGAPINNAWRQLMQTLTGNSRELIAQGRALPKIIGGRAGFELAVVIEGGLCILKKIELCEGDVFRYRPKLGKWDGVKMLLSASRHWFN